MRFIMDYWSIKQDLNSSSISSIKLSSMTRQPGVFDIKNWQSPYNLSRHVTYQQTQVQQGCHDQHRRFLDDTTSQQALPSKLPPTWKHMIAEWGKKILPLWVVIWCFTWIKAYKMWVGICPNPNESRLSIGYATSALNVGESHGIILKPWQSCSFVIKSRSRWVSRWQMAWVFVTLVLLKSSSAQFFMVFVKPQTERRSGPGKEGEPWMGPLRTQMFG